MMAKKRKSSYRYKSTMVRAEQVRRLSEEHYEPGNQARSHHAVWRRWIEPQFGICYKTYLGLLRLSREPQPTEREHQPSLLDYMEW